MVHHINGDKHDNRPDNLEIMNRAEHARKHFIGCKRPDMEVGGTTWKTIRKRRDRDVALKNRIR
jgi:hypothetical protein